MASKTALVPLTDIRDAIRRIRRYTKGKDLTVFRSDELVRDAVERCIEIVSEASRKLPSDLKKKHPEIPWDKVAAIGNVFRHEYDEISPSLVWQVVKDHLPALERAVNVMIRDIRNRRK
ncbi:MAG: HepT-like ribonuclease domain-containing protein [Pseudomonadota bacterium]